MQVEINQEENRISVWNNGRGVPVQIHQEHGIYVPDLIFGHLLTSSNYDDNDKKTTGGRNGFGAKLANIFSTGVIAVLSQNDSRPPHHPQAMVWFKAR